MVASIESNMDYVRSRYESNSDIRLVASVLAHTAVDESGLNRPDDR